MHQFKGDVQILVFYRDTAPLGGGMETQIILMLLVLAITIVLLVTELLRADVVALLVIVLLFWFGLVSAAEAFSGFASNAVLAIISLMILGAGIDRTGVTARLSRSIVGFAGKNEKRLLATFSAIVGFLSAFMQNIGTVALFLPALLRVSRQTRIPPPRLVMPLGFAAILGGTLTMIGSGALIVLNDLIATNDLEPFGIFAVTPLGILLLGAGIAYFIVLGNYVLPRAKPDAYKPGAQEILADAWRLPTAMHHYRIPGTSPLAGLERNEADMKTRYALHLLAITENGDVLYAPWRHTPFRAGQVITLLGEEDDAERFAADYSLERIADPERFSAEVGGERAGFAEIMVRPRAEVIGKTFREIAFRKKYGIEPIVLVSRGVEMQKDYADVPLSTADIIVGFGPWERVRALAADPNFTLNTPVDEAAVRKEKAPLALLCFIGGIALTLTGVPISIGLFTGALVMVLGGVLEIDEAYRSIDWKVVFLLAGLIPLGTAMVNTGTAALIADGLLRFLEGAHPLLLILIIGGLTTFFTLFMSNVGAVVILVPVALLVGAQSGIDPRGLALLVGLSASNSFILPTHHVNAFLMSSGGYRNADYLRAGSILTVIFLLLVTGWIYLVFA
ncbi:MAG: SLC13 family permease [Methanomicrobiales archaeon]|nr:SLC13 family permease [Methanomicrobiales archaeon]